MADVKISELNGATTPLSGTEVVPLVQNGETKKVAVSEIGGGANPTSGVIPVNDNGVFVDSVVSENSNKIGIGTTAPSTKLDVENQNFSFIRATQSGVGGLQFGASGGNGIINTTGVIDNIRVTTSNFMSFSANGGVSNQLSLTSVGNVGIGVSSATEKLEVDGIVKAQGYKSSDGSEGVTQNISTGINFLIIKNGIITEIL